MNRKVSIIIPVIRPASARRCEEAIYENAGVPASQFEIVTAVDTEGIGCPEMVKMLTQKTKYDLVMFLGDDTVPQENFLKNALMEMHDLPDGWGVVGLNSGGKESDKTKRYFYSHWLAHKNILEHIEGGNFFSTDYVHCWGDVELSDIAKDLDRWTYAKDSIITHYHPIFDTAEWDDGYTKAYSPENRIYDEREYYKRKRARMEKKYGTRLAIAEPLTFDMVHSQFHFSSRNVIIQYIMHLVRSNDYINIDLLTPDFPGQIDAVRNNLVEKALRLGSTHILMMDTDQIYSDPDMIKKMISHKKPVVGARVHRRYPPFDPLMMRGEIGVHYPVPDEEIFKDDEFASLVEVDATGCGCVLYDTSVFIDMFPAQWFKMRVGDKGQPIGEDIGFCADLKEAGIDIFVDCSIDIKHITLLAADWGTYKLYEKLTGLKGGNKNGKCK